MTTLQSRDRCRPTLELRVRSLAPDYAAERQRSVLARLDQLEADGVIDGYAVRLWGKKFCPETISQTEVGRNIRNRLVELDEWTARSGLAVAPFFQVQTGRSGITGCRKSAVVTPVLMLAEYAGQELRHVSPCTDGETNYEIDEHLDALETGADRVPTDLAERPRRVPALMPAIRDAERNHTREDQQRSTLLVSEEDPGV